MAIDLGDIPSGTQPTTAEKLQIRKAIGVGTTDAPTFLAQTLTGQSLTGTQATNLLDLATTWDTTGTPTAIKVNATNTNSNPATKFIDLQLSTVSKFRVGKGGNIFSGANAVTADGGSGVAGVSLEMLFANYGIGIDGNGNCQFLLNGTARSRVGFGVCVGSGQTFSFSDLLHTGLNSVPDVLLSRDAAGILAQRNGSSAPQAFRVYNAHYGTTSDEWGAFDWKTSSNTLLIGTQRPIGGTSARNVNIVSTAQVLLTSGSGYSIDFAPGGTTRWHIHTPGNLWATTHNAYDIGASGTSSPRNVYAGTAIYAPQINGAASVVSGDFIRGTRLLLGADTARLSSPSSGVLQLLNDTANGFTRIELGEANMGIMRGAGTPEGAVTAKVGSIFLRTDGGASTTLYVKESSPTPSTGWVAK